ncbi:MAG: hypothetical protein ACRD63_04935, partial [Pyrinomonadaceae bacterium]
DEIRRLCLISLHRINNEDSKSALLALLHDPNVKSEWQTLASEYLQLTTQTTPTTPIINGQHLSSPTSSAPVTAPASTPATKVTTSGGGQ